MTLKQAFTEWAAIPQNTALAARHRTATNSVLMKKYGDDDVRQFTAFYTRKLMQDCKLPQPMKTQAASILVHVLKYAAGKNACVMPDFDFSIAGERPTKDIPNPSGSTPKNSVQQKRSSEASQQVFGQESSEGAIAPEPPLKRGKDGRGGHNTIKVTQLSLKTLKPLRTFESAKQASEAVGLKSSTGVSKAVKSRRAAGGYYWCKTGEEKSFVPEAKRPYNAKGRMLINKNKALVKSKDKSCPGKLLDKSVTERGSAMPQATSEAPSTRTPLSSFSDQELKNELISRGWKGTLYKHLIF